VHVLGDATLSATAMPKSGNMANSQAKVCAAAVVALLNGREPDARPVMNNSCYSFVSDREAVHLASVHQWAAAQRTMLPVKGAGAISAARSEQEGVDAWEWARNIWADMFG
jgi:NADH dehydrogenase FAD-containing subunit